MPLLNGNTPEIQSENIRELRKSGRPETQAIAIALQHARQSGHHSAMAEVHAHQARHALHMMQAPPAPVASPKPVAAPAAKVPPVAKPPVKAVK